jgi:phenylacetate-CoA ligase
MPFVDDVREFLAGRVAFPAVNYALNRREIAGRYRELLATERASQEKLRELQLQKLKALVRQACETVPFYARRFKEIGLVPGDVKTLEDFQRIPPLDRQDVIHHRPDLFHAGLRDAALAADQAGNEPGIPRSFARFRKNKLVRNTSTGSTGAPTIFYEDGSTSALNWIHEQRLKSWYGIAPGTKEARMKGLSTAYRAASMKRSVREFLWNQLMLPGYFLGDAENEASLRKIRKFRPRVLWGPTPALVSLAQYIRRSKRDVSRCTPQLVISWAAPLYDHDKKLLRGVFGCPVSNIYSAREVGHIAMTCPNGAVHVNQENYLVEIEGANSNGPGANTGNILVTPLFESPMPFLRYRIGDVVEIGGGNCSCGRTLVTIDKILGRMGDMFQTEDGHLIDPNFWCLAFRDGRPSRDVEKFQVVYKRIDRVRFRIVRAPSYSADTEAHLRQFLEKNLPSRMQFEFEYVADIPPQPSGKYLFVVNEIESQKPELVLADAL